VNLRSIRRQALVLEKNRGRQESENSVRFVSIRAAEKHCAGIGDKSAGNVTKPPSVCE